MTRPTLHAVFDAYKFHPEFLGIKIAGVNQRGALDSTLLHVAARKGILDHIRVLVEEGADINIKGDLYNTPLHDAALCGQNAAVELLILLGADAGLQNKFGQTALDIAKMGNHSEVFRTLSGDQG